MLENELTRPFTQDFFLKSVSFELALGLLAFGVGAFLKHNPTADMLPNAASIEQVSWYVALGVLAALPLFAMLLVFDRFPIGPFRALHDLTNRFILPLFAGQSIWKLLLLSAAAGFGEEILFRGLVQSWLSQYMPAMVALMIGSVMFGVCHWLNTTYAILAMVMGIYLGTLFIVADSLLVPITTHAAYDFFALAYFLKWRRERDQTAGTTEDTEDDSKKRIR